MRKILVLALLSIAFSCDDRSNLATNQNLIKSLQEKGDLVVSGQVINGVDVGFKNENNKFDFVGENHNLILTEFLSKRNGKKLKFKDAFNLAINVAYTYSSQRNSINSRSSRVGASLSQQQFNSLTAESLAFLDSSFVKNLNIKDTMRVKFNKVFDRFVKEGRISQANAQVAKLHLVQLTNCPDLNTMLRLNNLYVNEIVNSDLPQIEKDTQLCYLSIFSYSLSLWYTEEGNRGIAGRKWWKWLVIGAADALGGFCSDPFLAAAVGGVCSGIATDLLGEE